MTIVPLDKNDCKWCGSSHHRSEACPTRRLLDWLTNTKEVVPPLDLPKMVVCSDENLIETVEEAHALMHIKKLKKDGV